MMLLRFIVSFIVILPLETAVRGLVLSERIVRLSQTAAELSTLAYEQGPIGNDYEHFEFFDADPNRALVARKNGYCYGVFRGAILSWDDWQHVGYNTIYRSDMEASLRECAKDCVNKDECVVLTGHSEGGAIAAVAGVYLADLNPYVITFGQPPTINAPCPLITSDRWYRYVNTKSIKSGAVGLAYDAIPFAPVMGVDYWGHLILLSDDTSAVAYIGLDVQDRFSPLDVNGFEAHRMLRRVGSAYPGYLDRVETIITVYANKTYPVVSTGYVSGSLCTMDKECALGHCGMGTNLSNNRCIGTSCKHNSDCDTGRCDSGSCVPKQGSCMVCYEHTDCTSGYCSAQFRCSGESKLMDNDCGCYFGTDCKSGRCEGAKPRVCEAQMGEGAYCNEASDCQSGLCSWGFRCVGASSSSGNKKASSHWTVAMLTDLDEVVEYNDIARELDRVGVSKTFVAFSLTVLIGVFFYYWYACFQRNRRGYEQLSTTLRV